MEKTTITLENGKTYDCGKKELENLKSAIKSTNSKKIVLASVEVLQSSEKMLDELVKNEMRKIEEMEDVTLKKTEELNWKIGDRSKYKKCPCCGELMYYVTRQQDGSTTMECKKCHKEFDNC